ncbi:MAG: YncE family protein [candidate division WOR-3 bacterium]|nr:MAG: YncE family protein [candidate division WOR-3 bacterium]
MKKAILAAYCLTALASGQWLEKTIWLPDSFGGLIWPLCAVVDTIDNKVYVSGGSDEDFGPLGSDGDGWVIVLDGDSYERIGRILVGTYVHDMCWNPANNHVYCMHSSGVVSVIDCTADSVVSEQEYAGSLQDICANSVENKVYALSGLEDLVAVIDGETHRTVDSIEVGAGVRFLYYHATANRLYCGFDRYRDFGIEVVDGHADSVLATLPLEFTPRDMCGGQEEETVLCCGGNHVAVIDPFADSLVSVLPVGTELHRICYNPTNDRIYCTSARDTMWVVSGTGDSVVGRVAMPFEGVEHWMHIACSPASNRVYCAGLCQDWQGIVVIDCSADSIVTELPASEWPFALVYNQLSNTVCCVNKTTDDMTVVDCAGDSVLCRVALGGRPEALCYCAAENKVYVSSRSNGKVYAIDGSTNRLLSEIEVGEWVEDLCYNPVLNKVYVANKLGNSVSVIDCRADTLKTTIGVGRSPGSLCFSPAGRTKVYVANWGDTFVSIIDCVRDNLIANLRVGGGNPAFVTANTKHSKVYCTCGGRGRIGIIDAVHDSVIGFVDTGAARVGYSEAVDKWYQCPGRIDVMDAVSDTLLATVRATMLGMKGFCYNYTDDKAYFGTLNVVAVLDGRADTLVREIWDPGGGDFILDLCYDAADNKVYVACEGEDLVAVIDGKSDEVLGSIAVGRSPSALVWNPRDNRVYCANYYSSSVTIIRDSMPGGLTGGPEHPRTGLTEPSIVKGIMFLPGKEDAVLLDIMGRKVMDLHPGENDIRHAAPGIYFVRKEGPRIEPSDGTCEDAEQGSKGSSVQKVVLQR